MRKYLLLLPLAWVLCACPLTTREEAEQADQRQMREQVSTMQKTKADNDLKYNDMRDDIRALGGRMDTLEHQLQVDHQNADSLQKTIDAQNEKIKLLQSHLDATETRLTAAINALSGGGAAVTAPEMKASDESAVAMVEKPKKKVSAEPSVLDEAESYLSQKEFKKAIVKYQAYIDKNPKGKSVGDATYKIGVCFAELGLKKDAKEFFKDVIENYPGTPWAKKAKSRLANLK